jgi:hypothetical protein
MLLEEEFLKQVLEYAKIRGWRTAHFRPGMMANGRYVTPGQGDWKGFPDVVAVRDSRLIFSELKKDDGEMSPEQVEWMLHLWSVKAKPECTLWTPHRWPLIQASLN